MTYDRELEFFQAMMARMNILTRRFLPNQLPELPEVLKPVLEKISHQELVFQQLRHNVIYTVNDALAYSMYLFLLPGTDEVMMVGPYLTQEITEQETMTMMESWGLPASLLPTLRSIYSNLTCVSDNGLMLAPIITLARCMWGSDDAFTMEYMESHYLLKGLRSTDESELAEVADATSIKAMEGRYAVERRLMYAVAHGQTHQAHMIIDKTSESVYEQRTSDPVRNLKNYAIICNTLMRKAAEEGQVHPLHIDRLSSTMARKIELLRNASEAVHFIRNMVHKYCLLVKNHSMKGYSQLVQHVILRVDSDLTADLSLKAHAEFLNVNPSYLSTLFRKETGMTLTEYVNRQRIEHGIFLLNATDM